MPIRRGFVASALLLGAVAATGCVSVAEFRKLEKEVRVLQREGGSAVDDPGARARLAELASENARLEAEIQRLEGRIDVVEHRADEALARAEAAGESAAADVSAWADAGEASAEELDASPGGGDPTSEIAAYRAGYEAARGADADVCIERFRDFLQTYPASSLADDAAYWMADCYFRKGEFKTAVLRFDDVVEVYPQGNKAADALYRQGEALLRLGPRYASAAGKAFERVIEEYPESARVAEAREQLEVLGSR